MKKLFIGLLFLPLIAASCDSNSAATSENNNEIRVAEPEPTPTTIIIPSITATPDTTSDTQPVATPTSTPTLKPTATPTPKPTPTKSQCDPNYSGCVPISSDVDCAGGSGNGPAYVNGPITVIGSDIYKLDTDHDGIACE